MLCFYKAQSLRYLSLANPLPLFLGNETYGKTKPYWKDLHYSSETEETFPENPLLHLSVDHQDPETLNLSCLPMDETIKNFWVDALDLDCLLEVKTELCQRQQGQLDSVLKSNLEFSIQAMKSLPAPKQHRARLTVEGDQILVRVTAGTPVLYYTVHSGPNGPQLHQRVKTKSPLTTDSLSENHFAGHQCRDEIMSCLEQAKIALSQNAKTKSLDHLELKITCGELHIMYSTPQPQSTLHIQPRRRVHLEKTKALEKILELKTQLEKSGEIGKSMQACFQHLLQNSKYLWQHSQNYQEDNVQILLQSDGEMMEFVIGTLNRQTTQCLIYTDGHNKVQELLSEVTPPMTSLFD